jgi:plasmid stabilization system protein ParE
MSGFALHPEAYDDIDQIRAYIAEDNPDAADRMVNEVFDRIRLLMSPSFMDAEARASSPLLSEAANSRALQGYR